LKSQLRLLLPLSIAAVVGALMPLSAMAATDPGLGTAGNFAVIAGSIVTNTGPSWITGTIGVSPGIGVPPHITGFPPGTSGTRHDADSVAATGHADLVTAFGNASSPPQSACTTVGPSLSGLTLGPGTYCSGAAATNLAGTLTLNGSGVYIFQMSSTLITSSGSRVSLIGGAQPCQVFWQVNSSATIGTSTTMVGTIMALTSIAMQTGATLNGRALAENGAVTLDTNRIIRPSGCGYGVPTYVPPPSGNILPATLGIPSELLGEIPWLFAIGAGSGLVALWLVAARRRRRKA
jgi:hypothetical protein